VGDAVSGSYSEVPDAYRAGPGSGSSIAIGHDDSRKDEQMFDDIYGSQNVIAVSFAHGANAYEALTRLKELDSQGQIHVSEAAVVVRDESGQVQDRDQVGGDSWAGTASGGLVGLLVGILGGPLGVLVGGATGLLVGSLFDLDDDDETESVLSEISKSIQVGSPALLAEVTEPSADVIDAAMAELGGTVLRRPVDDVEAEMAAAEQAQRAAKKKAREELREQRHRQHKEEVHEKVAALKAKLHPHEKSAAASS
jgi:uncharacterized membrane protein